MNLELASGRSLEMVSDADLRAAVGGEEFAILGPNPDTYIQCAKRTEPPYDYMLEYQDGSLDRHYQAFDGPIPLERVLAAFVKYLHGDASWRDAFVWEKMDLS
jgi:hypothetical protein